MTSLPPHAKFTFDTVFDDAGTAWAPPQAKRSYTPEEVDAIKAQSFLDGENSVVAQAEADCARALQEVGTLCREAFSYLVHVAHAHRVGSAELALAAGRKIADAALDRFPEAPVAAALASLAREVEAAPRLTVKVAAGLADRVQSALSETAQAIGFAGAIKVTDDATLPPAAFILEWGEGRAAFDPEAAARRVGAALETALAAEGLHAEPLIPSEADHG
jgi:flagellar assembly protein FliH